MYSFLFNQTYLAIFAISILVFLLMFLWRKLTILEGNYYLLEKRVNIIKKEERNEQLSKNIEKADVIMNEVFKNSKSVNSKENFNEDNITNVNIECDNVNKYFNNSDIDISIVDVLESKKDECKNAKPKKNCNLKDVMAKETTPNILPEVIEINDFLTMNNPENVNYKEVQEVQKVQKVQKVQEVQEVQEVHEVQEVQEVQDELHKHINNITNDDNVEYVNTDSIIETESITSDITFNNEDDKILSRKYKAMNLEKLREECKYNSLSTDGTKSMLITRIIENIKKHK